MEAPRALEIAKARAEVDAVVVVREAVFDATDSGELDRDRPAERPGLSSTYRNGSRIVRKSNRRKSASRVYSVATSCCRSRTSRSASGT